MSESKTTKTTLRKKAERIARRIFSEGYFMPDEEQRLDHVTRIIVRALEEEHDEAN